MGNYLAALDYGGYVSIVKVAVFAAGLFAWLPLVNWVWADAQAVGTDRHKWAATMAASGAVALWMWLMIPLFVFGLMIYLICIGTVTAVYVMHRNAKVADFEKILTAEHLLNLFTNPHKKIEKAGRGLTFTTANNNEVPMPEPKSPEAEGFSLTCELIDDAIWRRAGEITLRPEKEGYGIYFQIDGVTSKQSTRPREEVDALVKYLKQLADLEIEEKRKPQKGSFAATRDNDWKQKSSWEIKTAGSTVGEQIHLLHLEDYRNRKFENLGFNENQLETLRTLKDIKRGLVILSGPRQSGLTTTFYTMLGAHDPYMNNINTLEKQKVAELPNITQYEFSLSDTSTTTYARKLQSVLRRAPDIVGAADCDDPQSAKLACAAVEDNKIIYVTLDAVSVADVMEKWLRLVGNQALVAETLEAVINQRLVRMLCPDCRQSYKPNPSLFKKFNIPANEVEVFYRPGEIEYDKHGKPVVCEKCQGTGFYGRTGLFETIRITPELREIIKNAASIRDIAPVFRRSGMLYMQEQAIKKVALGITSINELIRNFSAKGTAELKKDSQA